MEENQSIQSSFPLREIPKIAERNLAKIGKENSFKEILTNLVDKVNNLENNADQSIQKLVTGEIDNIHQVMIAVEEADLAFRMMMEIRNKLVEAYQQIMRMQM